MKNYGEISVNLYAGIFYRHFNLTALSIPETKIRRAFKKFTILLPFLYFTFFKLHRSGIALT